MTRWLRVSSPARRFGLGAAASTRNRRSRRKTPIRRAGWDRRRPDGPDRGPAALRRLQIGAVERPERDADVADLIGEPLILARLRALGDDGAVRLGAEELPTRRLQRDAARRPRCGRSSAPRARPRADRRRRPAAAALGAEEYPSDERRVVTTGGRGVVVIGSASARPRHRGDENTNHDRDDDQRVDHDDPPTICRRRRAGGACPRARTGRSRP